MTLETATFGAGCFWGVEWVFRQVPGVLDAVSGYSGGHTVNPTYREVCSHTTGHAEVVQVTFDDERVSYEQLLEVFWAMHDPTQRDRQGPDVGDQYRSVVFTHSEEQRAAAQASREHGRCATRDRSRPRSSRSRSSTRPRTTTSGTTRTPATSRTVTCFRRAYSRTSDSSRRAVS